MIDLALAAMLRKLREMYEADQRLQLRLERQYMQRRWLARIWRSGWN